MEPETIRRWLSEHDLFKGFDDAEITQIAEAGEVHVATAGTAFLKEAEPAASLHFLLSGRVRVSKKGPRGFDHDLAEVEAGAIIGELGLLGRQVRTATVSALEDVEHFALPIASFEELLEGGSSAARKLLVGIARTVATRQQTMNQRIIELAEQEAHPDGTMMLSVKDIRERLLKAVSHGV